MKARTLTVEGHWESQGGYRKAPCPKVRLKGRWLQAAGFSAGQRVNVTLISPGVIELRVQEAPWRDEGFELARAALDAVLGKPGGGV